MLKSIDELQIGEVYRYQRKTEYDIIIISVEMSKKALSTVFAISKDGGIHQFTIISENILPGGKKYNGFLENTVLLSTEEAINYLTKIS